MLERTTHRVRLTDAGRALLAEARNALSALDAARDAVAAVQGGVRGTIRVGIMNSLRLIDLASALTRYHQQRPQVQIVPHTAGGGSVELVAGVLDGSLDMAFTALPGPYPDGLAVRPLASEPLLLACPDDHPLAGRERVAVAELQGEKFVDFPVGWGTRAIVDRVFEQAGVRREIAVEVSDVPTAVELVRAGFGCAFLGESLIAGPRSVTLRPVHPSPVFEVALITPTGLHVRRRQRACRAPDGPGVTGKDPCWRRVRTGPGRSRCPRWPPRRRAETGCRGRSCPVRRCR